MQLNVMIECMRMFYRVCVLVHNSKCFITHVEEAKNIFIGFPC